MDASTCYMLFACLFTDAAINGSNICIADRLLNCRGSYRQIAYNVEAMTSKGLRSDLLSTDTKLDASYNAGLTTKTFIGYSLCYAIGFYY